MAEEIKRFVGFSFIFLLFIVCPQNIFPKTTAQANLVEEENRYIVYAGNEYTTVIPKNKGPQMIFSTEDFGDVTLKINYISEYTSPTQYLNSLNHLSGKGYSLEKLEWETIGSSDINKTCVNLTRSYLDRNTSLDFSFNVFHTNQTIRNLYVDSISNPYLELIVYNWSYTPNTRGLAINLQAYIEGNEDYLRQGPFVDILNDEYAARILLDTYVFEVRLKSEITLIKLTGEELTYTTMFFANYNIAQLVNDPADFWISIPQITDVNQVIFSFICSIGKEQTNLSKIGSYMIFVFGLTAIIILFRISVRKRRIIQ